MTEASTIQLKLFFSIIYNEIILYLQQKQQQQQGNTHIIPKQQLFDTQVF